MTSEINVIDPVKLVTLEQIDETIFRGVTPEAHWGRVFGGQVIAQGLASAYKTVEDRFCHSLHAYFLRPGDPEMPIVFHVDEARDGGSFTNRRVVAIQKGKQILNMAASFKTQEKGLEHSRTMPDMPPPEELPSGREIRAKIMHKVEDERKDLFIGILPIETRPFNPPDIFNPEPSHDTEKFWFRLNYEGEVSGKVMSHVLMAYMSDNDFLQASVRPHGVSVYSDNIQTASLDHALWFHHDFDISDWFLYETRSPAASNATGLNLGNIFASNGQHVCTVAQEGLIRLRDK